MSKNPDERYQNCAELRNDLMRWTDPSLVRAILGAEADAARSFRPPPPELAEEDLRLLADDASVSRDSVSLRDLGAAEPSFAPRHQVPAPPMPVKVRSRAPVESVHSPVRSTGDDDTRWLFHFAIVAGVAGLLAIVLIAIFLRS